MTRAPRQRRSGESGFALLLVFLMAAMIAIMLYRELPRLAFESQRAKEQLLIERGEQYKRAIQLFVKKMNRYPGKIEELENTNNIRFLRRRYKDPMTGKEEWRLIRCGPGGVLLDSVNNKGKPGEKKDENRNTFIAEHAIIGAVASGPQQSFDGAAPARERRRRRAAGAAWPAGNDRHAWRGAGPAWPCPASPACPTSLACRSSRARGKRWVRPVYRGSPAW